MTKFVSISYKGDTSINQKFVKQTSVVLSDFNSNLELIASQIGQLSVREQVRFFRLILNYIDITSVKSNAGLTEVIELCNKLINVANDFYFEKDMLQMELDI